MAKTNPSEPRLAKRPGKGPRTAGQVVLSIFKWVGIIAVAVAVLAAGAFGAIYATTPIPNPNKDFQTNVSTVFYRDGTEQMGQFAVQNRVSIPLADMPEEVKEAIVAGENETFWTDPGISIPGIMRAVGSLVGDGPTIGGSTLTQQYVKVLYLTQDVTLSRKLTEIIIALKMGQDLSKEEILEGYLNTVYFGRGAYGIQTAAQTFFRKDATDLTLQESVVLASVLNSPNNLDPAKGDKQKSDLLERYQYTLNQMVKLNYITEAEKNEIYTTLPEFPEAERDSRFGGPKGFLLQMVQDELKAQGFSEDQVQGGGLQIITTVDKRLQDAAQTAAWNQAVKLAEVRRQDPLYYHPALASLDTRTGAVLALYGGSDYTNDFRNWATIPRPTGSTFKPWALVAGLREGATLYDRFNGDEYTPRGEKRPITNAGGRNYGPVTLERATTNSINSAYVDLVGQMKEGPQKVAKAAEDVGIPNRLNRDQYVASIPLGFAEVSPLEAARGLATLVNEGQRTTPHLVAEVRDVRGNVLYTATVAPEQTVETDVAQNAVHALKGVVDDGTASSVRRLGYQVAGKTGTYYDSTARETKATWFIGATRQISTAVVLTAGEQGYSDLGNIYGSTYAAPGWLEYMRVAMDGLEKETFPGPTRQTRSGKFSAPPERRTASPTASATRSAPAPSPSRQPSQEPSQEPSSRPSVRPTAGPEPGPSISMPPPSQPAPRSPRPRPSGRRKRAGRRLFVARSGTCSHQALSPTS